MILSKKDTLLMEKYLRTRTIEMNKHKKQSKKYRLPNLSDKSVKGKKYHHLLCMVKKTCRDFQLGMFENNPKKTF